MFYIHPLVDEIDISNEAKIIAADVHNPPFGPVAEIVEAGKEGFKGIWRRKVAFFEPAIGCQQGGFIIGILPHRPVECFFGYNMPSTPEFTSCEQYKG